MSRQQIKIDKKIFEGLCGIQCTEQEIADAFDCSVDTIERWCKREYKQRFAEVFAQKRSKGRVSLRRMQWKTAEKGDIRMLIWLGKQYLDQKETPIISTNEPINIQIVKD